VNALAKIREENLTGWTPESRRPSDELFGISTFPKSAFYDLDVKHAGTLNVLGLDSAGRQADQFVTYVMTHPDQDHQSLLAAGSFATATCVRPHLGQLVSLAFTGMTANSVNPVMTVANIAFAGVCNYGRIRAVENSTAPTFVVRTIEQQTADPVLSVLKEYEQLTKRNWDSLGADPIAPETLEYARRIMSVLPDTFGSPGIAPASDGSIALEWVPEEHHNLDRLFLDIGPEERWRAYWLLRDGSYGRQPGSGFSVNTRRVLRTLFDGLNQQ
jgi:hypothetical protein